MSTESISRSIQRPRYPEEKICVSWRNELFQTPIRYPRRSINPFQRDREEQRTQQFERTINTFRINATNVGLRLAEHMGVGMGAGVYVGIGFAHFTVNAHLAALEAAGKIEPGLVDYERDESDRIFQSIVFIGIRSTMEDAKKLGLDEIETARYVALLNDASKELSELMTQPKWDSSVVARAVDRHKAVLAVYHRR